MSTVSKVNFEPKSSVLALRVRDYPLADATLVKPDNATCLVDGEWFTLNSTKQLVRAADIATLGTAGAGGRATVISWPVWAERGRTDLMAMSGHKAPVIIGGDWEADTRIFDATAVVASGAAITTVMQPLKVATIVIGSRNYVGVVGHGGTGDAAPIVGYVLFLPAQNGGKLRMISGYRATT